VKRFFRMIVIFSMILGGNGIGMPIFQSDNEQGKKMSDRELCDVLKYLNNQDYLQLNFNGMSELPMICNNDLLAQTYAVDLSRIAKLMNVGKYKIMFASVDMRNKKTANRELYDILSDLDDRGYLRLNLDKQLELLRYNNNLLAQIRAEDLRDIAVVISEGKCKITVVPVD